MEPIEPVHPAPKPRKHSYFESLLTGPMTPKRVGVLVALLIVSVVIAGLSFWAGFRHNTTTEWSLAGNTQETSETPATTPTPTDAVTPAPTAEPTDTDTPTPTKKPTSTPTHTPTATLTPTPSPEPHTVTITSTASLDGFRASNNEGNSTIDIQAGRNPTLIERGFVSFDISTLPSGAVIEYAKLRMYQKSVDGDPFGAGSKALIEHVNYGTSFDTAYDTATLGGTSVSLSDSINVEWKEVVVTDYVKDDVSNTRTRSQYRLRLTTESTGGPDTGDFYHYTAADAGGDLIPQLIIRYH